MRTLKWDDVDLAHNVVTMGATKTGRVQRPLLAPARLLLEQLPRMKGAPYVFPGASPDRPIATLTALWYAVRHEARLEGVRLHDLRHSFASHAAGAGASLLVIGKLLGHKQSSTTQRYAHLADDPVRVAGDATAAALSAALGAERTPVTPIGKGRRRPTG